MVASVDPLVNQNKDVYVETQSSKSYTPIAVLFE